jgi:5-hydroxyisourate hydrolase
MISTHILDTSKGNPAEGIKVVLDRKDGSEWTTIGTGITNLDGRYVFDCETIPGIYRITFQAEEYLKRNSSESFFMDIPVIFNITNINRKYHVPLLLNPYGYSTYRGS